MELSCMRSSPSVSLSNGSDKKQNKIEQKLNSSNVKQLASRSQRIYIHVLKYN